MHHAGVTGYDRTPGRLSLTRAPSLRAIRDPVIFGSGVASTLVLMPAASAAHPRDPATYLPRGGPLTSGLKICNQPSPSTRSYSKKPLFVFSLMAQLLGRFSVGAVGGRIPHPVDTASEPARQPFHATSRRATLGLYP